jgi:hypothetical protein
MLGHDQELVTEASMSGIRRRRLLSAGGAALVGAGTLSLAASAHADVAEITSFAGGGRYRIYPGDPRYDTMRMGFNQRWVGAPPTSSWSTMPTTRSRPSSEHSTGACALRCAGAPRPSRSGPRS